MKKRFLENYKEVKSIYNSNSGPIIKAIYNRHKEIFDKYFVSKPTNK